MAEITDRPELGTTEAAVRACVNLIALATHTDEEHLAYWLDCYYQLRVAHEGLLSLNAIRFSAGGKKLAQEAPMASDHTGKIVDYLPGGGPDGDKTWGEYLGPSRTPAPAEEDVRATARVAPTEGESPEAAAAQKKKQGSADGI